MKKLALHLTTFKPSKFFNEFITHPSASYYTLISNNKNYRFTPSAKTFWEKWDLNKEVLLKSTEPKVIEFTQRIEQLKILVDFENYLIIDNNSIRQTLAGKKLTKKRFLIQILCLHEKGMPIELSQGIEYKFSDLLIAFQKINADGLFSQDDNIGFSEHEVKLIRKLLHNYIEMHFIDKMFDYFTLGGYELQKQYFVPDQNSTIYGLQLKNGELHDNNPLILSKVKQSIKERIIQESAGRELLLAREYEDKIKSNESLLKEAMQTVFDPAKTMGLYLYIELEKEGLASYKNAITNIYFPQEEIDVNKISLKFNGHHTPLIQVIYALGSLSSYSTQYLIVSGHREEAISLQKESILQIFTHYKEWRELNLNLKEQEHILSLLLSVNSKLPYSPLLQTDENEYLLVPAAIHENGGYERTFYNYVITNLMFSQSNHNEEENLEEHEIRAKAVANKLADKIKIAWPEAKVAANFGWPKKEEFWGNNGEVDLVIYFPEENLLILSEIKLCNSLSKYTQSKIKWLNGKIYKGKTSVANQLQRDLDFFRKKAAYPLISEALGLDPEKEFKPKIKLLALTDVFWIDHTKVDCNLLTDEQADCISIFEFDNLIDGKINFASEIKKENNVVNRGEWLFEKINNNTFWQGIEIDKKITKDYSVIIHCESTPHKIGLKV